MRKILTSNAAFIGFTVGIMFCAFYDVQVMHTLSALWSIISQLF